MPQLKSFYKKDNTSYNEAGAKMILELDEHLDKIYNDCKKDGYNVREISQLILNSTFKKETEYSFKVSEEIDKMNRQKLLDDRFKD